MKTSSQLQTEVEALAAAIEPLAKQLEVLRRDLGDAKSREFIAANNIRRKDVESPDDHGEYFGTVWRFADWLRHHSTKRWAEWNTIIYHTSDLINGRMPDMPARTNHLLS